MVEVSSYIQSRPSLGEGLKVFIDIFGAVERECD